MGENVGKALEMFNPDPLGMPKNHKSKKQFGHLVPSLIKQMLPFINTMKF